MFEQKVKNDRSDYDRIGELTIGEEKNGVEKEEKTHTVLTAKIVRAKLMRESLLPILSINLLTLDEREVCDDVLLWTDRDDWGTPRG